jgi:hypothetical protein
LVQDLYNPGRRLLPIWNVTNVQLSDGKRRKVSPSDVIEKAVEEASMLIHTNWMPGGWHGDPNLGTSNRQ